MQARKDQNDQSTALAVSTDNLTPLRITCDPVTDYILAEVTIDNTITITPADRDKIDQNDVHTPYGISDADGVTIIPIRCDSAGNLLAQLT